MKVKSSKVLFLTGLFFLSTFPLSAQSARDYYQKGRDAMEREQPFEAVESFKEALRLNPRYLEPHIGLAKVYYYLDEYDEALRYVALAGKIGGDSSALLNINGRILLALGKPQDASRLFKLVLQKEPYNIEAISGLAEFSLSQGDRLSALQQFQKSLQYDANDRRILLALALMYEEKGDRQRAEVYLLKAIDTYSEHPLVQALAASLYLERGDFAQAEFHAKTALSIQPNYRDALRLLGTINLRTARFSQTIAIMDQLIDLEPKNRAAWYLRGMASIKLKKTEDGISAFERVLGIAPNDEISRIVLEDTVIQELKPEDQRRSRYAAYHFDQALQFQKKNLNDRAAYHFRRGLFIAPLDTRGRQNYAAYLKASGQRAGFLKQLDDLKRLGVNNSFVNDNLEIYKSLLTESVSNTWAIDQFVVDRDPLLVRVFYLPNAQKLDHPLAEEYLANFFQTMLGMSSKVSFSKDRDANAHQTMLPRSINRESDAFSIARSEGADFYVIINSTESGDNFQLSAPLYLARTGNQLNNHGSFRTGNFRLQNAIAQVAQSISSALPLRGRLIKRSSNDGVVNLGVLDGLKIGDSLHVIRPDAYVLKGDAPGFIFNQEHKTASFKVARVDDYIASGTLVREGFFDKINIGDVILKEGESAGKLEQASANFPILYNKIRSIR